MVTPISGAGIGSRVSIGSVATGYSFRSDDPIVRTTTISAIATGNPVDNSNFTYRTWCDFFVEGSATPGQMGIYSAAIRYTIPKVPGT